MTVLQLILFLLGVLLRHGNLKIRTFPEGMNFLLEKKDFSVGEWEGVTELHIE